METIFKVVIVGAKNTGKTAFITRLATGNFVKEYIPTKHIPTKHTIITRISFPTNYGKVIFDICEIPNNTVDYSSICRGADSYMIFYSLADHKSVPVALEMMEEMGEILPNVPFVICGNKADCRDKEVHTRISFPPIKEHHISAKSNFSIEKSFLELARVLTKHNDLEFTEHEAIEPPTVEI